MAKQLGKIDWTKVLEGVSTGIALLKAVDFRNVGKRGKRLTALEDVVETQNESLIAQGKAIELLSEQIKSLKQN